jgi:hypothetical protein
MGKRGRKRDRVPKEPAATTDYADDDGNVLTLRDSLSAGTVKKLHDLDAKPAATAEDKWQRREEFLFERFAVGWSIAGLPLETQKELIGRYRMADSDTRRWVRGTIDAHIAAKQPELGSG